jgi:hypothetical protein
MEVPMTILLLKGTTILIRTKETKPLKPLRVAKLILRVRLPPRRRLVLHRSLASVLVRPSGEVRRPGSALRALQLRRLRA